MSDEIRLVRSYGVWALMDATGACVSRGARCCSAEGQHAVIRAGSPPIFHADVGVVAVIRAGDTRATLHTPSTYGLTWRFTETLPHDPPSPGTRVHANGKPGVIKYVRMAAPRFTTPGAYCVILDSRNGDPGYEGTIFNPADVLACTYDTALAASAAAVNRTCKEK